MKQISTFLSLLFSFLLLLGATGIASAKVDVLAHVDKDITVKENFFIKSNPFPLPSKLGGIQGLDFMKNGLAPLKAAPGHFGVDECDKSGVRKV